MTDILRRNLAPIPDEAWAMIDEEARRTLKGNLSARGVVEVDGPHGWDIAAVNLGRLHEGKPSKGVQWGSRTVLPLVEYRVPFSVDLNEMEAAARGAEDPDLDSLHVAARKTALFEETAVYLGFEDAGVKGLIKESPHKAITLPKQPGKIYNAVADAVLTLEESGVGGPYALVLGTAGFKMLSGGDPQGYPLRKRLTELVQDDIRWGPVVKGAVVISLRGGDYSLTLGQDISIGYLAHDAKKVDLYFTGSFTFRALDPAAAIELKTAG